MRPVHAAKAVESSYDSVGDQKGQGIALSWIALAGTGPDSTDCAGFAAMDMIIGTAEKVSAGLA